ncbi:sensor histidine kinase [Runella sp.]|uniref:sensor histidine kinase n=1 Tax=Runella sp. TaxID=1960881 RepID=UPI003D0F6F0A
MTQAQKPVSITTNFTRLDVTDELWIYTDTTHRETIHTVLGKKDLFKPFLKTYPNSLSPHWCFFTVKNQSDRPKNLILKYEQIFADTLLVYTVETRGIQQIDSPQSWKIPTPERPYPYIRYPVFSLTIPANTSCTLWIKLLKRDGTVLKLPFSIWDEEAFYTYYNDENLFRGFFYGWLFLVSLFSLLLFVFLRERIHLYYSLSVLFLILILATTGGTVNQMGWFLPAYISGPAGNSFFNMAYTVFNLRFTIVYVGANYLPKWLLRGSNYFTTLCISLFLALIFFDSVYNLPVVYTLFSLISIIYVSTILILLFYGVMRRSIGARFYLGAVSPLFISSLCYWLASIGVISYGEWIITSFKVAVLIEIFILSIGLAYHYFNERREKQLIQDKLIGLQVEVIKTQEFERRRIAADLHDDLGGTLSTIRRRVSDILSDLKGSEVARELADIEHLIQKSNDDLRHISHNLMPPEFARLGLGNALQQLVRALPRQPTQFDFFISGKERKLATDLELNTYRIVSELIQNIIKHAQATKAAIQLIYYDDLLSITVEDNGIGNRHLHNTTAEGIGLQTGNLRAEYIGAKLHRETSSGGTLVILEVPFGNEIIP